MLEKARVPKGEQIRKWYNEVVNLLKLKRSSIEDIQYTGLEHLIRQFNSEQINADTFISCDEEILENAPAISTDGVGFESERVANKNQTISDVLPYEDSIALDEREEQLNFSDNAWFIARKSSSRKQILTVIINLMTMNAWAE